MVARICDRVPGQRERLGSTGVFGDTFPEKSEHFQRQGNALAAADTQGNDTLLQSIPLQRVQKTCGEDGTRGADRMAVGNGPTFFSDESCDLRRVSRMTAAPNTVAGVAFRLPPYVPMGVRTG